MGLPVAYSVRNVRARLARTGLTIAVIALAVVACSVFLALISSLKRTLVSTGSPDNLVVLRKGSDNDGSSMLPLEAYQAVRYFDGVARDDAGDPLASPEMVLQPFLRTHDGGRENVLIRGVERVALARLRPFVTAAGEAAVNPNTAPREVLTAVLGDAALVERVLAARQGAPIDDARLEELVPGTTRPRFTARGLHYTVRAVGSVGEVRRAVEATLAAPAGLDATVRSWRALAPE